MTTEVHTFADIPLSRRLERTEAQGNIDFVEARARTFPESGARWIEEAGAFAMFDGPDSPLTQTFGLGIAHPVTPAGLDRIERFFTDLGAPVFHEVSPLAEASAVDLLNARGYEPFEFTSVMFRAIDRDVAVAGPANPDLRVRTIRPDEVEHWAATSARGWSEQPGLGEFMLTFGRVSAHKASGASFLAELAGEAIATAGLSMHAGVALLAGASTVPSGRRQGAQNALLAARLRHAAVQGCDLAMMCALPGSPSQRNAERQGFRIAYTRMKWRKRAS